MSSTTGTSRSRASADAAARASARRSRSPASRARLTTSSPVGSIRSRKVSPLLESRCRRRAVPSGVSIRRSKSSSSPTRSSWGSDARSAQPGVVQLRQLQPADGRQHTRAGMVVAADEPRHELINPRDGDFYMATSGDHNLVVDKAGLRRDQAQALVLGEVGEVFDVQRGERQVIRQAGSGDPRVG